MLGSLLVFGLFYFVARAISRSNMSRGSKGPLVAAVWLSYLILLYVGIQEIEGQRKLVEAIASEEYDARMRGLR